MKLTIIYDNEVYKKDIGLKSDWGFSCLIEKRDETILFDTGAKGRLLLNNMQKLDVDPNRINKVVISHEHWDHNGGLKELSNLIGDAELYRFTAKSPSKNMHLKTVKEPSNITEGVFTTGRLKGSPIDEQSLVLEGKNGWYVLAGCSHPGVKQILDNSSRFGNIVGLIGGLHGFNDFSVLDDLEVVCPTHCTKYKTKIYELFPKTSAKCGVGRIIEI